MAKCEKCGHEFDYNDPSATKQFYEINLRSELTRGYSKSITYCRGCAPFGNTKIPEKLK